MSPYVLHDSSLHMVLTPWRRFCGKFVANMYASGSTNIVVKANPSILDRPAGLSHGCLIVGIMFLVFQGMHRRCTVPVFLSDRL